MGLLEGAIDFHYHAGPALFPRARDYVEVLQEAAAAGLRAVVVKDHHYPTAAVATVVSNASKRPGTRLIGALVLNNHVGGWNPFAVEAALKLGARVIWMPTLSAAHHIEAQAEHHGSFPVAENVLAPQPLRLTTDGTHLVDEVHTILELIAAAGAVLATGHLAPHEISLLLQTAREKRVEKIVIDHPDFIVGASPDEIEGYARQGAYIEFVSCTVLPASSFYTYRAQHLFDWIRRLGSERVILGSDLGQAGNPSLTQGLEQIGRELIEMGLRRGELDNVLARNPANLLELT
ncbi:MAG: DUF6282 family protein [Ardenticatenaceae bacterium]|nr:DUF6282 family protein [Ardenticatenaceae bacterium]